MNRIKVTYTEWETNSPYRMIKEKLKSIDMKNAPRVISERTEDGVKIKVYESRVGSAPNIVTDIIWN